MLEFSTKSILNEKTSTIRNPEFEKSNTAMVVSHDFKLNKNKLKK